MTKLRILLTGGGTGGHIYPLIAVTQELNNLAAENGLILDARYFGGAGEYYDVFLNNGIRFTSIISSKFRRDSVVGNLLDIPKFFLGFLQALWKIYWFMPAAAFSKGGPGALPVILACRFYFIPIVIQESDSVPGKTNLYSGKFARKIFIAFQSAAAYFSNQNKVELAGNPVRPDLLPPAEPVSAKQKFGFDASAPVLLILGGSQGATRINSVILENLEPMLRQFQILHQVGEGNFDDYKNNFGALAKDWPAWELARYKFVPFFSEDLRDAYSAADLVLARAGAGTIFELAAFGKPSILTPLPEAAGDHQRQNAYQYERAGAALVIEQDILSGNLIIAKANQLFGDFGLLQKMSAAAKSFYNPSAARIIATSILEIGF